MLIALYQNLYKMHSKNTIFMTINILFQSWIWYYETKISYFDLKIAEMRIIYGYHY